LSLVVSSGLPFQVATLSADSWVAVFPILFAVPLEELQVGSWLVSGSTLLISGGSSVLSSVQEMQWFASAEPQSEESWRAESRSVVPVAFSEEFLTSWSSMQRHSQLVSQVVLLLSSLRLQRLVVSSSSGVGTLRVSSLLHLPGV
jgi:hypothetical protein